MLGPMRKVHDAMVDDDKMLLPDDGLQPYLGQADECEDRFSVLNGEQEMTPNLSPEKAAELQMMVNEAYTQCRSRSRVDPLDPRSPFTKRRDECEKMSSVEIKGKKYAPVKGFWFEKVDLASVAGTVGSSFKRYMLEASGKQAPRGFAPSGARFMRFGGVGR